VPVLDEGDAPIQLFCRVGGVFRCCECRSRLPLRFANIPSPRTADGQLRPNYAVSPTRSNGYV
jgi:hypothetical protein